MSLSKCHNAKHIYADFWNAGCKGLSRTNALGYLFSLSLTKKKSFITVTPRLVSCEAKSWTLAKKCFILRNVGAPLVDVITASWYIANFQTLNVIAKIYCEIFMLNHFVNRNVIFIQIETITCEGQVTPNQNEELHFLF